MKKITIASLDSINNVGDELLGNTTEFLVHKVGDYETERVQLMPSYSQLLRAGYFCAIFAIPLDIVARLLHPQSKISFYLWKLCYNLRFKKYYYDWIKSTDSIILPVGMLKFANQNFSFVFELINQLATKYSKPVLMSAMSIARKDERDIRYHQLVNAVNLPCVNGISTRDGEDGLFALRRDYLKRNIISDYVGDPALWSPELYKKNNQLGKSAKSNTIGINVIRKNIFSSYKEEIFSSEQLKRFYIDLVRELDDRKINWVFYCNGMQVDYEFGEELINELNLSHEKLLPRPKTAKEYIDMICDFKAIFGARLHACITATSLGIPVVGMLWDNKLKYFSKTMGTSQFYLTSSVLDGKTVANKLIEAMNFEFAFENREAYKQKTLNFIRQFLCENCK